MRISVLLTLGDNHAITLLYKPICSACAKYRAEDLTRYVEKHSHSATPSTTLHSNCKCSISMTEQQYYNAILLRCMTTYPSYSSLGRRKCKRRSKWSFTSMHVLLCSKRAGPRNKRRSECPCILPIAVLTDNGLRGNVIATNEKE